MKKKLIVTLILFLLYPTFLFCHENTKKTEFESFLSKFSWQKLPIKIPFDSISYYNDHQRENANSSISLIKTKYLNITNSKYLPHVNYDKKELKLKLLAIYKLKLTNNLWAVIYNRSLDSDFPTIGLGDWLILCTFDSIGNRIACLPLTGYTFETIEQSCEISKDLKIKTHRFEHSTDFQEHTEILSEFYIDINTGKITHLKSICRNVKDNPENDSFEPLEPYQPCKLEK